MHHTVPDSVVDAFMALLAEKPFEAITLTEIAERAGLSLGALREAADGKFAILASFLRHIDRAVLDGMEAGSEDSGRDRLFDLVMRRLDRLAPHKAAIAHLADGARRDPALAFGLNGLALASARYMLAAAGIGTVGLRGLARIQGLAVLIGRIIPVWLDDADPDQSRTMAALDRALSRAEDWDRRTGKAEKALCRLARPFRRSARQRGEPRRADAEATS